MNSARPHPVCIDRLMFVSAVLMTAASGFVHAGARIDLRPTPASPLLPNSQTVVHVYIVDTGNPQGDILFRGIFWDFSDSNGTLNFPTDEFDFDLAGSEDYAVFPELPQASIVWSKPIPPPAHSMYVLPNNGEVYIGSVLVNVGALGGTLTLMNADHPDPNFGARVDFGFGGAGDPITTWRAFTGELTGGTLALSIGSAEGACCLETGSCLFTTADICTSLDGTPAGPGTNCEGDVDIDGLDGTCGDNCPIDHQKTTPGFCGCGLPETDTDGDGTPNCVDGCPSDPSKTSPGACGCGNPNTDSDGDGTPNCMDGCPNDPTKVAPGQCGCGQTDSGPCPCGDCCPNDPAKTMPGICGCGMPDIDSDLDGVINCNDLCPDDPDKTVRGACGCGVADTDSDEDGIPDCHDGCPDDPEKIAPGACGCGEADVDSDSDGILDCNDDCPSDPDKTEPGLCGCGMPDIDTNGDGIGDECEGVASGGDMNDNGDDSSGPDEETPSNENESVDTSEDPATQDVDDPQTEVQQSQGGGICGGSGMGMVLFLGISLSCVAFRRNR